MDPIDFCLYLWPVLPLHMIDENSGGMKSNRFLFFGYSLSKKKTRIENMTFEEFGLSEDVMRGLDAMNFKEATPVQEQTIPVILQKEI